MLTPRKNILTIISVHHTSPQCRPKNHRFNNVSTRYIPQFSLSHLSEPQLHHRLHTPYPTLFSLSPHPPPHPTPTPATASPPTPKKPSTCRNRTQKTTQNKHWNSARAVAGRPRRHIAHRLLNTSASLQKTRWLSLGGTEGKPNREMKGVREPMLATKQGNIVKGEATGWDWKGKEY